MSKHHKNQLDTEGRLLLAARDVFAQKGLHGASTSEISAGAGVQKSTLHYYYRHKEDLYAEVFRRAFEEMIAPLAEQLTDDLSFPEVLRAFVAHHVRAYADHPVNVRLWIHENLIGAPVAVPVLQESGSRQDSPYRIFVDSLSRAVEQGEIRPVDPAQTFVSVMGACLFLHVSFPSMASSLSTLLGPEDGTFDFEAFLEAREEAVFDLIHRGLAV